MLRATLLFVSLGLAAGCSLTSSSQSGIYAFDDSSVTLLGPHVSGTDATFAEPTAALMEQARDVCPTAVFVSASPNPTDDRTSLYLFQC